MHWLLLRIKPNSVFDVPAIILRSLCFYGCVKLFKRLSERKEDAAILFRNMT